MIVINEILLVACVSSRRDHCVVQTPEMQSLLQTAEEPQQRCEEQGQPGGSTWKCLQRTTSSHGSSGQLREGS